MTKITFLRWAFCLSMLAPIGASAGDIVPVDGDWKFNRKNSAAAYKPETDASQWDDVTLPHTWNGIDGQDGGTYYRGVGWYRKTIDIPADYAGKTVYLRVGAANISSTVYVNGKQVGTHNGGYASFMFDITDNITPGAENLIAIKVDNSSSLPYAPLSGDFTFFGGLTRTVSLLVCDPVHINPIRKVKNDFTSSSTYSVAYPGVIIRQSEVSETSANVSIETTLRNANDAETDVTVEAVIKDAEGKSVASQTATEHIAAADTASSQIDLTVTDPHLWNGTIDPYLYRVEVTLKVNGTVTDRQVQPLGLRYFSVDSKKGFFLNGKSYPLRGIAFHEDRENKGRAITDAERKEDIDMLLETGANYFRLTHYQHGDFTYNYLDSLGIVCWTEIPVVDRVGPSSTLAQFRRNATQQLYELISQQFNHPSVCFWGVGNEVTNNPTSGENPTPVIEHLNNAVKAMDTSRLTTLAANYERAENLLPDVYSMNRYQGWYNGSSSDFAGSMDALNTNYPSNPVGVSEYGAGANTTQHEYPASKPTAGGHYHPEEYQNAFHEAYIKAINARPYLWSTSIWAGFDFASDSRNEGAQPGINDKGIITHDHKTKKDVFYLYKANWNKTTPFVYITSRRYTQRNSLQVPVKVYSNCDQVSLSVNGTSIGQLTSADHIFLWDNVAMNEGKNTIIVNAVQDGTTVADTVTWECTTGSSLYPEEPPAGEIQINFGTSSTADVDGYWKDDGSAYGDHGEKYEYGWNADNTENARERSAVDDVRYDSFVQFGSSKSYTWSIGLPDGDYLVSVACGDASYTDSYHRLDANGKTIISFAPGGSTKFGVGTDTVTVTDGKLKIATASNGSNPKINFVHITSIAPAIPDGITSAATSSYRLSIDGDDVVIVCPDAQERTYRLYDVSGKSLATGNGSTATLRIPMSGLPAGNYAVSISQGNDKTNLKFRK